MRKQLSIVLISAVMAYCGVRGTPTPPKRIVIPKPKVKFWQMGNFLVVVPGLPEKDENGEKIIYRRIRLWLEAKKKKELIYQGEVKGKILVKIPGKFFGKKLKLKMEVKAKSAHKLVLRTKPFTPLPPPLPPEKLSYSLREEGILLTWKPPKKNTKGEEISPTGYMIFKNGRMMRPVFSPFFLDRKVVSGKKYVYRVSALLRSQPPYIMSMKSEKISLTYIDKIPPSPPSSLEALVSGRDVYLQWKPSPSPDLAGYLVLRDGKPAGQQVATTSYWDKGVKKGKHTYQVVAVDRAGNRSTPSNKVEVEVK